ncbi:MAG: hypothetical protein IJQ63_12760 [Synergistaceae bacterium]|nr:hypothetical protein [Synergistaceae bacterium]
MLLIAIAVPASAYSLLYSFSSGDTLDPSANPTYGVGRIDFIDSGDREYYPVPEVIFSSDTWATAVGKFKAMGGNREYLYVTRTDKKATASASSTTGYIIYSPAGGLTETANYEITLHFNPAASLDILLPPDEYNGLIYAIDQNGNSDPVLKAFDARTGSEYMSVALDKGYTEHKLVALLPDSYNYVYVWSSKRSVTSADGSYTSISSDITAYDRSTLAKVAYYPHVRTGFDVTAQKSDDEKTASGALKPEFGRGLVYIAKSPDDSTKMKSRLALVVYDEDASTAAKLVEIDEAKLEEKVIVTSSDINGWNIDIESPMPDYLGGVYFQCYSGDLDGSINSKNQASANGTTLVYHLPYDSGSNAYSKLLQCPESGVHTTSELVVPDGTRKGQILVYKTAAGTDTTEYTDNQIRVYVWTGRNTGSYIIEEITDPNDKPLGAEVEKPYPDGDGSNGLFFMLERKVASGDEADSLYHWIGYTHYAEPVWQSGAELEIELATAPKDDDGNFYFVNVTSSVDSTAKTGVSVLDLRKCYYVDTDRWTTALTQNLGSFDVPKSIFDKDPNDPNAMPIERLQSEFGFYLDEDDPYDALFVGAGPAGGDFRLTVMDWATRNTSLKPLVIYSAADMGGYAGIAGMIKFTETYSSGGSSSGCNAGFGGLLGLMFMFPVISACRSKFRK